MTENYIQEKWSPIKHSWLSRIIFSIKYSTGIKRIIEIISRLIGVVVISYFIGFFIFLFSNLFVNSNSTICIIIAFLAFCAFDIYKYIKVK